MFLEKEEEKGGEREREKHRCDREVSISCLLYVPQLGIEAAIQACVLTMDQSQTAWCMGRHSSQLSHIGQGWMDFSKAYS